MSLEEFRREQTIELTDEQLAKLNRIWTSDSCPRRQYHRIIGDVDPLPVHFSSWKGSAVHRIIEKSLIGEEPWVDWGEFPGHEKAIRADADNHVAKFNKWMKNTDIDLSEAEVEVKYEVSLPLGYVRVRKIDLVTPTWQFDWKTGTKRNTLDYRIDLASGWDAVNKAGDGNYAKENLGLVFTGGPEAELLRPFDPAKKGKATPFEEAYDGLMKRDEVGIFHRESIKAGVVPPCKTSYFCGMCPYRHVCRGV